MNCMIYIYKFANIIKLFNEIVIDLVDAYQFQVELPISDIKYIYIKIGRYLIKSQLNMLTWI